MVDLKPLSKKDVLEFPINSLDRQFDEYVKVERLEEAIKGLKKEIVPVFCTQCEDVKCFFYDVHTKFHKYNKRNVAIKISEVPDIIDEWLGGTR